VNVDDGGPLPRSRSGEWVPGEAPRAPFCLTGRIRLKRPTSGCPRRVTQDVWTCSLRTRRVSPVPRESPRQPLHFCPTTVPFLVRISKALAPAAHCDSPAAPPSRAALRSGEGGFSWSALLGHLQRSGPTPVLPRHVRNETSKYEFIYNQDSYRRSWQSPLRASPLASTTRGPRSPPSTWLNDSCGVPKSHSA
jgi:hypothetical protein